MTGSENRIISDVDQLKIELSPLPLFLVYFLVDSDAILQIEKIKKLGANFLPEPDSKKTPLRFRNKFYYNTLLKTWDSSDKLSHLKVEVHENLLATLDFIKNLDGYYIEIGVYKGGSAYSALTFLKETNQVRETLFIDTFNGFDYEESRKSFDSEWFGTHKIDENAEFVMDQVKNSLGAINYPFRLQRGNICDKELIKTLPNKVAFLNIDVDQYEATKSSLEYGYEVVVPKGVILLEGTASTPRLYGAAYALQEFLNSVKGSKFRHLSLSTHDLLIRN